MAVVAVFDEDALIVASSQDVDDRISASTTWAFSRSLGAESELTNSQISYSVVMSGSRTAWAQI